MKDARGKHPDGKGAAKALVDHCLDTLNSTDNISAIVVFMDAKKQ